MPPLEHQAPIIAPPGLSERSNRQLIHIARSSAPDIEASADLRHSDAMK